MIYFRGQFPGHRRRGRGQQVGVAPPVPPRGQRNRGGTLTPSPQGSPLPRRVRIAGNRSVSSDAELDRDDRARGQSYLDESLVGVEDGSAPKHKRTRVSQVIIIVFLKFFLRIPGTG